MFKLTVIGCVAAVAMNVTMQALGGVICSGESPAMRVNSPVTETVDRSLAEYTSTRGADVPQIRNVKAFQQYPWGSKIYITYEVVGSRDLELNNRNALLLVTAKDIISGITYRAVSVGESCLHGDTGFSLGLHKIDWDIAGQGWNINSDKLSFTVSYCDELYLVIDLSSGATASSYLYSYIAEPPSGGFNVNLYKREKLALRCIWPGSFKMCGEYDVSLTKPYFIGLFEITQKQYKLVMGTNPAGTTSDTLPVSHVSYNMIRGLSNGALWPSSSDVDTDSFMGKLRARTGLNFDLPTEAEWEYACRAGTTSDYNNGSSSISGLGWTSENGSGPVEVGSYQPNSWGLYDMHGNVGEWCLDWYGTLIGPAIDPVGTYEGNKRVIRGGGGYHWYKNGFYADINYSVYDTSSSYRGSSAPSEAHYYEDLIRAGYGSCHANYRGFRVSRR